VNPITEKIKGSGLIDAVGLLKNQLGRLPHSQINSNQIIRLTADIDSGFSPLEWLKNAAFNSKIYWSDRSGDFEMAGAGECRLFEAASYDQIENTVNAAVEVLSHSGENIRIYGGISFPTTSSNSYTSDWAEFKSCRLVIPRFELLRFGNQNQIACNVQFSELGEILKISNELDAILETVISVGANQTEIVKRQDEPDFVGWRDNIKSIFDDFSHGKVEKIVLARQTSIHFRENCDMPRLLDRLTEATPHCYHYYFQPVHGLAFLGASPEQLYSRRGRQIASEALAGTRPRGMSPSEDLVLGEELLHNDKELREHKYVVENIKRALGTVCEYHSENNATRLLKLNRVQHLQTKFNGTLKKQISDSDIIKSLHPTAAVGGYPSHPAQSRIAQCEKFDRGWYAGAVGWLSKDGAEFAVAIRSGLVRGKELKLFSGAGIVEGSTPEAEWAEIESKIGSFLSVVTG
jgi:menaquinone-specific isochorismate synthase